MSTPKFVHDDTVKVLETGQVGLVKAVHQRGDGYVYGVQLNTTAENMEVPEAELELVSLANDGETGFHLRYIS